MRMARFKDNGILEKDETGDGIKSMAFHTEPCGFVIDNK